MTEKPILPVEGNPGDEELAVLASRESDILGQVAVVRRRGIISATGSPGASRGRETSTISTTSDWSMATLLFVEEQSRTLRPGRFPPRPTRVRRAG